MQAIQTLTYNSNIQANFPQLEIDTIAKLSFTGLLFLSLSIPMAGNPLDNLHPVALEDSYQDLSVDSVTAHFKERLPSKNKGDARKLAKVLMRAAEKHRLSPGLLLSVIDTESSFRYTVVSKAGAIGLMQLLPGTAAEMAKRYKVRGYRSEIDLVNPVLNIQLGSAYLAYLRTRFGSSYHYLAAYNMGPTALRGRINKGIFDLGAIQSYVDKIELRTRELRKQEIKTQRISSLLAAAQ